VAIFDCSLWAQLTPDSLPEFVSGILDDQITNIVLPRYASAATGPFDKRNIRLWVMLFAALFQVQCLSGMPLGSQTGDRFFFTAAPTCKEFFLQHFFVFLLNVVNSALFNTVPSLFFANCLELFEANCGNNNAEIVLQTLFQFFNTPEPQQQYFLFAQRLIENVEKTTSDRFALMSITATTGWVASPTRMAFLVERTTVSYFQNTALFPNWSKIIVAFQLPGPTQKEFVAFAAVNCYYNVLFCYYVKRILSESGAHQAILAELSNFFDQAPSPATLAQEEGYLLLVGIFARLLCVALLGNPAHQTAVAANRAKLFSRLLEKSRGVRKIFSKVSFSTPFEASMRYMVALLSGSSVEFAKLDHEYKQAIGRLFSIGNDTFSPVFQCAPGTIATPLSRAALTVIANIFSTFYPGELNMSSSLLF
jgi:hypothetical protein